MGEINALACAELEIGMILGAVGDGIPVGGEEEDILACRHGHVGALVLIGLALAVGEEAVFQRQRTVGGVVQLEPVGIFTECVFHRGGIGGHYLGDHQLASLWDTLVVGGRGGLLRICGSGAGSRGGGLVGSLLRGAARQKRYRHCCDQQKRSQALQKFSHNVTPLSDAVISGSFQHDSLLYYRIKKIASPK